MHVLRGLCRDQAAQCMSELRRRFYAAADQAGDGMAAGTNRCEAAALGQAGASVVQPRGHCGAFGETAGYSPRGALASRRDRALDLAKADAIAVALAPAA